MKFDTIEEATRAWVQGFNAIPQSLIEKLVNKNLDEVYEITPPAKHDHVHIYSGDHSGMGGEIVEKDDTADEDNVYIVELYETKECVAVSSDDFEVQYDGWLPMWGTMWTFGEQIDEEWANGEYLGSHLQEMADCGFRIYEQEDLGLIFGIDGCGYDFYEAHWIPLYKARGLHWHKEEENT